MNKAALLLGVLHIVGSGSGEQMVWINAARLIAGMTNFFAFWYFAEMQ